MAVEIIHEELFRAEGWFTPLLKPAGWFDDEYTESLVEEAVVPTILMGPYNAS
jgi:hypothetical protein